MSSTPQRQYICPCGREFESSQSKASHCKNCPLYQKTKQSADSLSGDGRERSSRRSVSHSPMSSTAPSPATAMAAPTPITVAGAPFQASTSPPRVIVPLTIPVPIPIPQSVSAAQHSSPAPLAVTAKSPIPAAIVQVPAMVPATPPPPSRVLVPRSKAAERLDQDNYTDPTGGARRTGESTTSALMSDLLAGGGDELVVDEDGAPVRKKRKQKRAVGSSSAMAPKSLAKALEECGDASAPAHVPAWSSAAAGPPVRPRRHFCTICGSLAPYRCRDCSTRFCSLKCNETHKATRCLKSVR